MLARATELGGGTLTATGLADPLGPMMIMGSMAVAAVSHRAKGPLASRGGFELPLTDFALAALAAAGPGRFAIHPAAPQEAHGGRRRWWCPAGRDLRSSTPEGQATSPRHTRDAEQLPLLT